MSPQCTITCLTLKNFTIQKILCERKTYSVEPLSAHCAGNRTSLSTKQLVTSMTKGNFWGGQGNCTHWIGCSFWASFRSWSLVWCLNCLLWCHAAQQNAMGPQADPGSPGGPTPCPQDLFKIMQFLGNFKGKIPILSKFWAQGPPGVKTPLGPPPDQNPGSAPGSSPRKRKFYSACSKRNKQRDVLSNTKTWISWFLFLFCDCLLITTDNNSETTLHLKKKNTRIGSQSCAVLNEFLFPHKNMNSDAIAKTWPCVN